MVIRIMQPQDNVKITDLGGTENSPIFNFISPVLRRIYTHTQSHEGSFVVGPLPALEHGLEMLMFSFYPHHSPHQSRCTCATRQVQI